VYYIKINDDICYVMYYSALTEMFHETASKDNHITINTIIIILFIFV